MAGVRSRSRLSLRVRSDTAVKLGSMTCRVEDVTVLVLADGDRSRGFDTEARASSKHAMRGSVLVRPTGDLDHLRRALLGRPSFALGVGALDAVLTARVTSEALGRAVLDDRAIAFLQLAVSRPLRALCYSDGSIAVRWAGLERAPDVLTEAIGLVAHLAVIGGACAPYR